MSRYTDSDIPDTLTPVGGWKGDAPAPAPPAAKPTTPLSPVAPITNAAVPAAAPVLTPAPLSDAPKSRFDVATPAAAPTSRFSTPPPAATPAAKTPELAPVPHLKEQAYSKAGAYARGQAEPMTSGRMATGIFAGLFLGGIVFAIWMVIYFFSATPWCMLGSAAVGYTVGWAVFKGTGEGEETSCWISCFISIFYILLGVGLINYFYIVAWGFPNIITVAFGIAALYLGVERGYRLPEVLAVETA